MLGGMAAVTRLLDTAGGPKAAGRPFNVQRPLPRSRLDMELAASELNSVPRPRYLGGHP
jgi:hypothetical protein